MSKAGQEYTYTHTHTHTHTHIEREREREREKERKKRQRDDLVLIEADGPLTSLLAGVDIRQATDSHA